MAEEETPLVSVEEQITTLEESLESLEVPSFGDDLEGEALELAQKSQAVAQESYDANIARIKEKIEELKEAPVADLEEGGNEYGEDGPPVSDESPDMVKEED